MRISFRLINGSIITLDIESSETIYDVKIKLSEILNTSPDSIKLFLKTSTLLNGKRIQDIVFPQGVHVQVIITNSKRSETKNEEKKVISIKPKCKSDEFIENSPKNGKKSSTDSCIIEKRKKQTLPPRKGQFFDSEDPPHFRQMVMNLEDLGFETSACERALRISFYNSDRAVEYLLESKIPDNGICSDIETLRTQRDEVLTEGPFYCYPKDEVHIIDNLTTQQQQSIMKLTTLGFDRNLVIQVYEACGRDELVASSCLVSMTA